MTMIQITTKYGSRYNVNDKGEIIRLDQPEFKPSRQWLMRGIRSTSKQSQYIDFAELNSREKVQELMDGDMLNARRHPKWTVCDFDHGTQRVWGNTEYHGINYIQFLPADYSGPQ
jgi:hypothetical protein